MRIYRAVLGKAYILVVLLALPFFSFAENLPVESFLRSSVVKSSSIVVGSVIGTEPFDRTKPERKSKIIVSEVVYGKHSKGDSILVHWSANEWYPTPEERVEIACGGGTQLDSLQSKKVLWLLLEDRGLKCSAPPLQFEEMSKNRLNELVRVVELPDSTEIALTQFYKRRGLEISPDSETKRSVFIEFLRGVLANK